MQRPHRHTEIEINFIEEGAMTYLFGGTRTLVSAGQLALFWATIPHQVIHIEQNSILHWVTIPFTSFLHWQLPDVLTQPIVRGNFVLGPQQEQYAHQQRFRQWYSDLQANTPEHRTIVLLEVEAYLRRFALTLAATNALGRENITAPLPAHEASRVELMASFISDHYTESLPIDSIAQQVHLHPNYAMSLFRKSFGISIVDYITQYRVAHGQRLLITTDMNISEIALDSGFGSVSRFYTAFKNACNQSPGEYRASLHVP